MSITFTSLNGGTTTTDATSNTSASISPTTNSLIIALFGSCETSQPVDTPTISDTFGAAVTWHSIATKAFGTNAAPLKRVSGWWGVATGGAGTVTATCVDSQTGWARSIFQLDGANTTTPIVQTNTNFSDTGQTSGSVTLSGVSAANTVIGFFGWASNSTATVGSGFTAHVNGSFGTPTAGFLSEYNLTGQNTVDFSAISSAVWGGIAFEVAASSGILVTQIDRGLPRGMPRGLVRGF